MNDGDSSVYGYADGDREENLPHLPKMPANFAIRKQSEDDLWEATWKDPHELGDEIGEVAESVRGTRERCVEWVTKRAAALEKISNA